MAQLDLLKTYNDGESVNMTTFILYKGSVLSISDMIFTVKKLQPTF